MNKSSIFSQMITRWPYRTTAAIWLFAMVLSVGAHHFLPLWLDISNENIPLLTMAISSAVMTIFVFGLSIPFEYNASKVPVLTTFQPGDSTEIVQALLLETK